MVPWFMNNGVLSRDICGFRLIRAQVTYIFIKFLICYFHLILYEKL
jgi:hypothetical protein